MNKFSLLLLVLIASLGMPVWSGQAEPVGVTFYLQLIRGVDDAAAPTPAAQPIGPKLGDRLHSVFKWKHYWEIKRDTITVQEGAKAFKRITADRSVEVTLVNPGQLSLSVYKAGKLTRTITQSTGAQFFIVGGDTPEEQSWFVVLRRDKPSGNDSAVGDM